MGQRKPLFFLLAAYYMVSFSVLVVWEKNNWFPVTGDEPHYLVMASGIVKHRTLEQTLPYKEEFESKEIYKDGLAPSSAQPSPANSPTAEGPHGLYSLHNVGLPLIVAPAFAVGRAIGVKVFLVLLSGITVILAWRFSEPFTADLKIRLLAIVLACFGLPLITAANQVSPDLLAGIISLSAVTWMGLRLMGNAQAIGGDLLIAGAIAFQPWLHLKLVAPALLSALALASTAYRSGKKLRRASAFVVPLCVSLVILATYNKHAFGKFAGPYPGGALHTSLTSLMVFLGLHLDQLQGILFQNPAYFIGLIFLPSYVACSRRIGITTLLLYGALVIPNALYPNWYGGDSFAGRFIWSGAAVFIAPTVYGVIKLGEASRKGLLCTASILILLQVLFFARYTSHRFDFYTKLRGTWLDTYPSFYSPLQEWLPAFYDRSWAFRYQPNYAFLIFAVGLLCFGAFYAHGEEKVFKTSLATFVVASSAYILTAGATSTPRYDPLTYEAISLPSQTGEKKGHFMLAGAPRDPAGFITFGPYVPLKSGQYKLTISYFSSSASAQVVGKWDVVVTVQNRIEEMAAGEIPGSQGVEEHISRTFRIPSQLSRHRVEIRTYFYGKSDLAINDITIAKAN
jgi:hypothetical protein